MAIDKGRFRRCDFYVQLSYAAWIVHAACVIEKFATTHIFSIVSGYDCRVCLNGSLVSIREVSTGKAGLLYREICSSCFGHFSVEITVTKTACAIYLPTVISGLFEWIGKPRITILFPTEISRVLGGMVGALLSGENFHTRFCVLRLIQQLYEREKKAIPCRVNRGRNHHCKQLHSIPGREGEGYRFEPFLGRV